MNRVIIALKRLITYYFGFATVMANIQGVSRRRFPLLLQFLP